MRAIIADSKARSVALGIAENQVISRVILSPDALLSKIIQHRELILATEPFMNQLYDFVRGSNFIAILTDPEGCILSMIGDEAILQVAQSMQMVPGAYMDEGSIGTNAMGTALHLGEPVQVSGTEHAIAAFYRWTCSCAVIRDENQQIIGALDLTGYKEGAHSHTLGMVVAAVRAIENTLKLQRKNKTIEEQATLAECVMNLVETGMLICDDQGKIHHANAQAEKMIGYRGENPIADTIVGKPLWHLLKDYESLMAELGSQGVLLDRTVALTAACRTDSLQLSASPVKSLGTTTYYVLRLDAAMLPRRLKQSISDGQALYTFDKILGASDHMRALIDFAKQVADSRSTILITGESGTGKEVFAHAIHNHSERRQKPFVVVNCAAIPANLIESELFGYDEGAFTGAKKGGNPGKFEIADGGTLFLDEIGDMPIAMQTRLLRVLQEGVVCRVGSHHQKAVDVRLIAATNQNLSQAVSKGDFRLDLFYRLNVLPMQLPALRERREDIPMLADFFLSRLYRRMNLKAQPLLETELDLLKSYTWPGNIRELENAMEWRANTGTLPSTLQTIQASKPFQASQTSQTAHDSLQIPTTAFSAAQSAAPSTSQAINCERSFLPLEAYEKHYVQEVYKAVDGNLARAAKILGIARNTLYKKLGTGQGLNE